jgi:hypothetical protein
MHNTHDKFGLARRVQLEQKINNMNKFSIYIQSVYCVNQMLKKAGIGISENAYYSISQNLTAVANGRLSESSASLTEARVFARDTMTELRRGQYCAASFTAFGTVVNGIGGPLFFAQYDREYLSAVERHLYDNFHY